MLFRKSLASLGIIALAVILHGATLFLAMYGMPFARIEPPPPPLSISVQLLALMEQAAPAPLPPVEPPPAPSELHVPPVKPAPRLAQPRQSRPVPVTPEADKPASEAATDIGADTVAPHVPSTTSAPVSQAVPSQSTTPVTPSTPVPPRAATATIKTGVSIPAKYAAGNRAPVYPRPSIQYNEQGVVTLRVFVNADETAGEVEIKKTSGYPLLDQAAKDAVQSWRFEPARIDGAAVGEWYQVNIPFKLLH